MRIKQIIILFILKSIFAVGQSTNTYELTDFSPKSPEAGAFLKYGEYPIDLSTGTANINIPIYSIEAGSYKLPISLDYHPSGIKVADNASWTGLGWNLNFGAQIILEVRDTPDEYIEENYNELPTYEDVNSYLDQNPINGYYSQYINNLTYYKNSYVRDVYNFSSPTASGKFIIDKYAPNYEVTIYPPDAFKVEVLGPENRKFKITDVQGNVYMFTDTRELSKTLQQYEPPFYTSAWFVDKIITATNEELDFEYVDGGDISIVNYQEKVRHQTIEIENHNCVHVWYDDQTAEIPHRETLSVLENGSSTLVTKTKKIAKISFPTGRILFGSSVGRLDYYYSDALYSYPVYWPKKLDDITIESKSDVDEFTIVKKLLFNYSYFISSAVNTPTHLTHRLKLDSITDTLHPEDDTSTTFTYSNVNLPIKNSKSIDYWGYYNAKNNLNSIPHMLVPVTYQNVSTAYEDVGSADRSVNPSVIEAGILKEIQYPTGGITKFDYEPNTYYGVDKFSQYTLHNITGNAVIGTGSGQYVAESIQNEEDCLQDPDECVKYLNIPFTAIHAKATILFQHVNPVGSDPTLVKHQYTRVRVYDAEGLAYDSLMDNSGTHDVQKRIDDLNGSGYILLEAYGNYMSIQGIQLKYYNFDPSEKNNYGMGVRIKSISNYNYDQELISKKSYEYFKSDDPEKSSGELIKDVEASFRTKGETHAMASCCNLIVCAEDGCFQRTFGCAWKTVKTVYYKSDSISGIEGNSVVYSEVREKSINRLDNTSTNGFTKYFYKTDQDFLYDTNGLIKVESNYKRGNLIKKEVYRENGTMPLIVSKTENFYTEDNSRVSHVKGFKLFQNVILDNYPVNNTLPSGNEILEIADYDIPVNWYYKSKTVDTEYFYDSANILSGKLINEKRFYYNNPTHLQLNVEETTNSKGEVLETRYYYPQDLEMANEPINNQLVNKNMIGVPLSTQTFNSSSKLSEVKTLYRDWGNGLLLPEYIQTAKAAGSLENRIRFSAYDEYGHPTEVQQDGGTVISYLWGYNHSQPIAKIVNISNNELQTSLGVANLSQVDETYLGAIDALRSDPAFANAMITTFTYKRLVGVELITDPKGNKTTYEYDSFGRLKAVYDTNGNKLSENEYHYRTQN